MNDLEKMVSDELTKAVSNKRLYAIFRNSSQSVLGEIRKIAERLGANFLSMGFEYNDYVLTMGLSKVRQMEQFKLKKSKFVVVENDGKRMAIAKHKIISVKEITERNSGIVFKKSLYCYKMLVKMKNLLKLLLMTLLVILCYSWRLNMGNKFSVIATSVIKNTTCIDSYINTVYEHLAEILEHSILEYATDEEEHILTMKFVFDCLLDQNEIISVEKVFKEHTKTLHLIFNSIEDN